MYVQVASGHGSHVAYFAANFPKVPFQKITAFTFATQVTWQPSDLDSSSIESVRANR